MFMVTIIIVILCAFIPEIFDNPIDRIISSTVYVRCIDGGWSGSGVIVDKNKGYIVTAAHVIKSDYGIDSMSEFEVIISDGRKFKAVDWYYEDITDVGFLQIDANDLVDVEIGDSDKLELGDKTYITGAPFGLELFPTITYGIMSGLSRNIPFFGEKYVIQSDAGSWPGNSGGGLFDLRGNLVGVLVGGYYGTDNIGLCIPSNIIKLSLAKFEAEKELELAR